MKEDAWSMKMKNQTRDLKLMSSKIQTLTIKKEMSSKVIIVVPHKSRKYSITTAQKESCDSKMTPLILNMRF